MSKILIEIPDDVDYRNYDILYFILDAITNGKLIPDNATNGDMIKAMFPNYHIQIGSDQVCLYYPVTEEYSGSWIRYDKEWWDAPYKSESEETE